MEARRNALKHLPFQDTVHAGLWIDKMLPAQNDKGGDEGKGDKGRHIQRLSDVKIPVGYREAFKRWRDDHEAAGHALVEAKVQGRMVIGIGQKGPLEVGLTLNHTWGVPYIPGSALKGIAAATAHKLLQDPAWLGPKDPSSSTEAGESYQHMFGLVSQKGRVVFHDAWWIPAGDALPLKPDVMTVHHADYYQKDAPPSDTDSPNPVSFVSVTGSYLIALEGEFEWCNAAADILRIGAEDLGVGAKTRAGYGRLTVGAVSKSRPQEQAEWLGRFPNATPAESYQTVLNAALPNKGPQGPAWMSPDEQARLLRDHLWAAVSHAERLISGGGADEDPVAVLQAELDALLANKPKDKKGDEFKKWDKRKTKLENQLQGAQSLSKGASRKGDEAQRVLDWCKGAQG